MDGKGDEYQSLKSLTVMETNFDENAASDSDPELSFEESFASRNYAGSFRLRFSTTDASTRRGKEPTIIENVHARDSDAAAELALEDKTDPEQYKVINPAEEQEALFDAQQASLNFTEAQDVGDNWIAALDNSEVLKEQSDHEHLLQSNGGQEHSSVPEIDIEIIDSGDHSSQVPALNGNKITNNVTAAQGLVGSPKSPSSEEAGFNETQEDDFNFFAPEEEPVFNHDFRKRAMRAVESTLSDDPGNEQTNTCSSGCCQYQIGVSKNSRTPYLTPEMNRASNLGFSMLRKVLFPALPKFLTDILVFAELGVTITQFVLSLISISIGSNRAYNITFIVVAGIALILALIDAFLYFIELGSCARIFRYCYAKQKRHHSSSNQKCHFLNPKVRNWLSQSFELVRTLLSELLIYPLVVLDLFDLIVGGTYLRRTPSERINFSLFIIGSTFLVLSVYFTRTFMVISAAINVRRTPLDPSKSKSNMIGLVTRFCVHVILQIVVHATIIAIVGVKIHQENPTPCEDLESSCTVVSGFLIYIIIAGGILPLYGIGVFFIVDYYNLRELSIGFWINMLALLQSESFATAIFSNTGIKESKERAKRVIEKFKYKEVKNQLKKFQSAPSLIKVLYPLRFPFLFAVAAFYEILLVSFVVCLAFSVDQNGQVQFVLFEQGLSSAAFISVILILIANLHVLSLVSLWIIAAIVFMLLLLLQPLIWLMAFLSYVPVGVTIWLTTRIPSK